MSSIHDQIRALAPSTTSPFAEGENAEEDFACQCVAASRDVQGGAIAVHSMPEYALYEQVRDRQQRGDLAAQAEHNRLMGGALRQYYSQPWI